MKKNPGLQSLSLSQEEKQALDDLIDRMLILCEVVWSRVRSRLCTDAPETEEDELDGGGTEDVGGPKDLLSYSWRALRDSR